MKVSRAFFFAKNWQSRNQKKEPFKIDRTVHSLQIIALSSSTTKGELTYKRDMKRVKKMNFGWNLFTATSNIKLVSFFLSSLLYPKRQFIWKTVTKQRITELPNCFIPSSLSFSHSLLLLHSVVAVVVEAACYCCCCCCKQLLELWI